MINLTFNRIKRTIQKPLFLSLRLISNKRVSISQLELYVRILDGTSYIFTDIKEYSSALRILTNLQGALKSLIKNWAEGNESSSLVTEMKKMSVLLSMINFSD